MFDIKLYNDEFFAWHKRYAEQYSLTTGQKLFSHFKPDSVVDFGCGIGSYLVAAQKCGVKRIRGYEIGSEYAKVYTPDVVRECVDFEADITQKITVEPFDISICVEVAEHIEPSGSDVLVQNITAATKKTGFCLWTAAPVGQDGCGHINCQPKDYWISLFKRNGFARSTAVEGVVRELIKESPRYILDNLVVFCAS